MYMCSTMSLLGGHKHWWPMNSLSQWSFLLWSQFILLFHLSPHLQGLEIHLQKYILLSNHTTPTAQVHHDSYKHTCVLKHIHTIMNQDFCLCIIISFHHYLKTKIQTHKSQKAVILASIFYQNQSASTAITVWANVCGQWDICHLFHSMVSETSVTCFTAWSVRRLSTLLQNGQREVWHISQHGQWDVCHLLYSMVSDSSVTCFTSWSVRCLSPASQHGQRHMCVVRDICHLFHSMVSETSVICFTAWSVRRLSVVSQHGQWDVCHLFHSMVSERSVTCFTAWSVRHLSLASQHGQWDVCHLFHSMVNETSVGETSVSCFTAWSVRHLSLVSQHGEWDVCHLLHSMVSEMSVTCFTAWSARGLTHFTAWSVRCLSPASHHGQWEVCHLLHSMVRHACKCSHAMHVMWCEEMWLHWSAVLLSSFLSLPRQPDTSLAALRQVPSHDCPASSTPSATQTTVLVEHRQQFLCNTDCGTQQFLCNTDCATWTTVLVQHRQQFLWNMS